MPEISCPICKYPIRDSPKEVSAGNIKVDCKNCGVFLLTQSLWNSLSGTLEAAPRKRPVLSFQIRKMQRKESEPLIDTYMFDRIVNFSLPKLEEQGTNLIVFLGDELPGPGHSTFIKAQTHQAVAGAVDETGFGFVIKSLKENGEIEGNFGPNSENPLRGEITLTLKGWKKYEDLKKGHYFSKKAFMAMKFGDEPLMNIFLNTFKPAVLETGFELQTVNENPQAGLIDIKIQNDIRISRFLIADLSHHNNGAYWEAGFAEGLGKPVIYSCQRSVWESDNKPHFDTNHRHTIIWDETNLEETKKDLKATIRATLPGEAILEDRENIEMS